MAPGPGAERVDGGAHGGEEAVRGGDPVQLVAFELGPYGSFISANTSTTSCDASSASSASRTSAAVVSTSVIGSAATMIQLGRGSELAIRRICSRNVRALAKNSGASNRYSTSPSSCLASG